MQATTIGDLIKYLQDEDQDSTVIYQYYTAEHFDTDESVFKEVAYTFDSVIPNLSDAWDTIASTIADMENK